MKPVVEYVRVSTASQAEKEKTSLPDQGRELTALARSKKWEILQPPDFVGRRKLAALDEDALSQAFGDPGISGEELEKRPGMMALLAEVQAGRVGALLVRDTNRLSRDELVSQRIYAALEAHDVPIVTPGMSYDWDNLQHRLMLGLLSPIDAHAKRWNVMNMARGKAGRKARGEFGDEPRVYGYRWIPGDKVSRRPGRIEVHPEEAPVVQSIFSLAASGHDAHEIADELERQAIRTRRGTRWQADRVRQVLRQRHYVGEWFTAPGIPAKNPPPALIDARTFAKAQRSAKHRWHRRPRPTRPFILAGLVECGYCGHAMTTRAPRDPCRYYGCNWAMPGRGECAPARTSVPSEWKNPSGISSSASPSNRNWSQNA